MRSLVTGGGRGIGRAISLELAAAGFDVTLTFSSSPAAANDTACRIRDLGREAHTSSLDLRRTTEIHDAIDRLWDEYGPFDALVNNAGAHSRTPFVDITPAQWADVIDLDLTAPAFVAQQFARRLIAEDREGAILNIGSINGFIAYQNLAHYCAAKGGLHMLTRAMALELAPRRVRVNAIAPGLVDTDLTKAIMLDTALLENKLDRIPMRRPGRPEEIASLAIYLLDQRSSWMTGNVVVLDGGQLIH